MANHISHAALPYPIYNARYTVLVPYLDADGDPTDPTTPDTEVSQDAGAYADATEEVTTITGSNGTGYITLTAQETDCSAVAVAFKVASGPKATVMTLQPRRLPILESGTASAGAAGSITLASGTYTDLNLTNCFVRTTGGTGGGTTANQARRIISYNTSTRVATVAPDWETTPDNTTTYDILLPEGVLVSMLTALPPTTLGRTLDVSSGGEAGVDWANVGSPTTTVNLSGTTISTSQAVASVSGAVGSVTGNVGGNVTGSVGSVAAGGITASSIATDAIGSLELAADAVAEIADAVWDEARAGHVTAGTFGEYVNSNVTHYDDVAGISYSGVPQVFLRSPHQNTSPGGNTSTTFVLDSSASSDNDFYNGSYVMIIDGGGYGQVRLITDYVGATRTCTVDTWVTTPGARDYIIIPGYQTTTPATIADAVWDEARAGHVTAGTFGEYVPANATHWAGTAITATSIPVATAAGASGGLLIAGSNAPTTFAGSGASPGLTITGGSTATGALRITGGSTSGAGVHVTTTSGDGLQIAGSGGSSRGISVTGGQYGFYVTSSAFGVAFAIEGGSNGTGLAISADMGSSISANGDQPGLLIYTASTDPSYAALQIQAADANGRAMYLLGGSRGIVIEATSNTGIAAEITGIGTNTHGLKINATGTGNALELDGATNCVVEDVLGAPADFGGGGGASISGNLSDLNDEMDTVLTYLRGTAYNVGANVGPTGNDTTHVHLVGASYPANGLDNVLIVIEQISTGRKYPRWVRSWNNTTSLATVDTLPFTPGTSDLYWIMMARADVNCTYGLGYALNPLANPGTLPVDVFALEGDNAGISGLTSMGDQFTSNGRIDTNLEAVDGVVLNTHEPGCVPADVRYIVGASVNTGAAQLGVNVVSAGGVTWGSGSITSGVVAASAATEIAQAVLTEATADPIHANVKEVNNVVIDGVGTAADPWGPV